MPYTHLRTFHSSLLNNLTEDDLKVDGQWPKAGGDTALFYYLIEKADPDKVICVTDINYVYNDMNPINDYKVNGVEQNITADKIISKSKLFTVVVPTMWKYEPFVDFLNELLNNSNVGEVILIDNDPTRTPVLRASSKLRYITFGSNIFVNPSWNYGVENASYDYVCILNDDLTFDLSVFNGVRPVLDNDTTGVIGITPGHKEYNQTPVTDGKYQIVPWQEGMHQFGYGCLMFVNKNNWTHIPDELKIYYGDYFIFDNHLANNRINYCIVNMFHNTPYAQTCVDMYIKNAEQMAELQENEGIAYEDIKRAIWSKPADVQEPVVVEAPREKVILIAIPTNKNIEAATFKSIYDLKLPAGYRAEFQYFYGYQIDQIRNLIAHWGQGFDYLFCVDSDIVLPNDTLLKMIESDKDIISGVYIQRIPDTHRLELYYYNEFGGVSNVPWDSIKHVNGLLEVAACGFGCVLIKSHVLRVMDYPHFVYTSAIDHANTISEDVYFCQKARDSGFTVWCDTTIICDHIGSYTFKVNEAISEPVPAVQEVTVPQQTVSHGPKQAFVIRTFRDELSKEYAEVAEESCRKVGLTPITWVGYNKSDCTIESLTTLTGIQFGAMDIGAACATAAHFGVWKHIASLESDDPVVVLEHDALMLHPIEIKDPIQWDGKIIALGYKIDDPAKYDHVAAGRPNKLLPLKRHSGAHAYMITPNTARQLLDELSRAGARRAIDNFYFMRVNDPGDTESIVPLSMLEPVPAIGWLRKSTIWVSPSTLNYDVVESFSKNLRR
jgi:hypothetical protein